MKDTTSNHFSCGFETKSVHQYFFALKMLPEYKKLSTFALFLIFSFKIFYSSLWSENWLRFVISNNQKKTDKPPAKKKIFDVLFRLFSLWLQINPVDNVRIGLSAT